MRVEKFESSNRRIVVETNINNKPTFFTLSKSFYEKTLSIYSVTVAETTYGFDQYKNLLDSVGVEFNAEKIIEFANSEYDRLNEEYEEKVKTEKIEQRKKKWESDFLRTQIAPMLRKEGFVVEEPNLEAWIQRYSSEMYLIIIVGGKKISIEEEMSGRYCVSLDWSNKVHLKKPEAIVQKVKSFSEAIVNEEKAKVSESEEKERALTKLKNILPTFEVNKHIEWVRYQRPVNGRSGYEITVFRVKINAKKDITVLGVYDNKVSVRGIGYVSFDGLKKIIDILLNDTVY